MTIIQGTLRNSGGGLLTGTLTATLAAPIVNRSTVPDTTHIPQPVTSAITNGVVNVDLPESETSNVTYRIQVATTQTITLYYFSNGSLYSGPVVLHTDGNWYTGAVYTAQSVRVFQDIETKADNWLDFQAIVPNRASCEFADLLPTGIARDTLDTSLRRLAEILTSNVNYRTALQGSPRWQGNYSATAFYQYGDAVAYGGSTWIYLNAIATQNQTPSTVNVAYWMLLAAKGDPGGTGGNNTAYDAQGWNGQTDAPSRNAIRNLVENILVKQTALAAYAPLSSPALATPTRTASPTAGDRSLQIPTTQWVGSEFAALLNNTALTGNPTCPTPATQNNSSQIATTAFVVNYVNFRLGT